MFTQFYQETWFIILIAVISAILAAVLVVVLFVFIYRHSCKMAIRDLQTRYDEIHDSFSTDCSNMIKRIEIISKNNSDYKSVYDSVNLRFSNVLTDNDKGCYIAVESLKKLVEEKNYKDIKSIINSTKLSMDSFAKEATLLNNDLQMVLKNEEELRARMVALKERFRTLKNSYSDNSQALEPISESFDTLINHLTDLFVSFEDYLNSANYQQANALIPKIEQLIEAGNKVMVDLPTLTTLTFVVVPQKIEELEINYNKMEQEGYPLHHLLANQAIKEMNEQLEYCKGKLAKLSISNVSATLDGISMRITQFFNDFEKEKNAKEEFDSMQGIVNNLNYKATKQYSNLSSSLPKYMKVYVISQTYITQMTNIGNMINDMTTKKRMLDGFINSETKQPYSVLMATIKDLKNKIDKIQNAFDDFHNYLVSLKQDTETVYTFIRTSYEKIKEYEFKINQAHVVNFAVVYLDKLNDCMNCLLDLNSRLSTYPINVLELNEIYQEYKAKFDKLYEDLDENLKNMARAEDLIVYDNRFRDVSDSCKNSLYQAEKSFIEGDFGRASMIASQIYKTEVSEGN